MGNKEYSKETKMIVVADADVIRNQIQFRQGSYEALPLGMDKYNGRLYGNKDFILNAVNYLCDDKGLLEMRTRELSMRLLDKAKIEKDRGLWQMINVVLPIIIIVLIGIVSSFIRVRRYKINKV
jgi:ABC-2 type transport system permease protein